MQTDDLLMDTWLQWQINALEWFSLWMNFDTAFIRVADGEVRQLCAKLKQ